jgi:hypothetical protein
MRDWIDLSPLNSSSVHSQNDFNPANSFKWLYLLYSLAARRVSPDPAAESDKTNHLFRTIKDFLLGFDLSIPGPGHFAIGVICFTARLFDQLTEIPKDFLAVDLWDRLAVFLSVPSLPPLAVALKDFVVHDLVQFLLPVSVSSLPSANLFQNPVGLLRLSVLRLLPRAFNFSRPEDISTFRTLVCDATFESYTTGIARPVLGRLFDSEEEAAAFVTVREYDRLSESLSAPDTLGRLSKLARSDLRAWTSYLSSHPLLLTNLIQLLGGAPDPSVLAASVLRLSEIRIPDLSTVATIFVTSNCARLRQELGNLLLAHGESALPHISGLLPAVCRCGSRCDTFFDFFGRWARSLPDPGSAVSPLMDSVRSEFASLQRHGSNHLYESLARVIDVSGFYLDATPCDICHNPERAPARFKLADIRRDVRYQATSICSELQFPVTISEIVVSALGTARLRSPKLVRVFATGASRVILSDTSRWTQVCDLEFSSEATRQHATLRTPFYTTAILIEFCDFWTHSTACRHCGFTGLEPRSSLCPRCHESLRACARCHRSDWGSQNPFVCSECGHTGSCTIEAEIFGLRAFSHSAIADVAGMAAGQAKTRELVAEAQRTTSTLATVRASIGELLSPLCQLSGQERTSKLDSLYNDSGRKLSGQLAEALQHIWLIRTAMAQFVHQSIALGECACFTCRAKYIKKGIAAIAEIGIENAADFFLTFLQSALFARSAADALAGLCRTDPGDRKSVV